MIPSVDVSRADELRRNGTTLIDVREQAEWDEARIPGALFRPLSEINDWYADLPTTDDVVVYCRSGARSAKVIAALMTQAGHTNLHNLTGGILAWSEANLPLDT